MFGFLIAFSWYLDSKVAVLGVMMSQNDLAADLGKKENEGAVLIDAGTPSEARQN